MNIKGVALTQKLLARLTFQRGGQNDRQDKKNMPPDLQSRGHKKTLYVIKCVLLKQTPLILMESIFICLQTNKYVHLVIV